MTMLKYKLCLFYLLLGVVTKASFSWAFLSVSFSPQNKKFASSSSLHAVEIMASSVDLASATATAAAAATTTASSIATTTTSSSGGLATLFDDFLRSQPFLSAFMMCGFKASAADLLAQTSESEPDDDDSESETPSTVHHIASSQKKKDATTDNNSNTISHYHYMIMNMIQTQLHQHDEVPDDEDNGNEQINFARTLAFLLYGGLYQGMFLQLLYMIVYPFLYGESQFRIPLCICTDVFMFGPFVTLPIAYIIRAVIDNLHQDGAEEGLQQQQRQKSTKPTTTTTTTSGTFQEAMLLGIDKYKNHIVTQDLLLKYWLIWTPAQSINNIFVPEHLRVFFVAFISFFWVFLLSIISNQESTSSGDEAMNSMKHEPARQTS